ncbi:MAG: vitamin B12-dependent ribonucleotide reductase, partial [Dehalococcoidia bacterium]|nr:vitamin B12-dependent ribonucleotide reductase [Dehalococcoidia bacterium]
MRVERRFTEAGKDPLQDIVWETRKSETRNSDGGLVFILEGVQVPDFWSQVATDILAQKYFRKVGVTQEDGSVGGETHSRQVFERLSKCWRFWGEQENYFDSPEDAQAFEDETIYMLAYQMAAPNSPQWFNTGLHHSYGIMGPGNGHWYFDAVKGEVVEAENAYERMQTSACFIQSLEDTLVSEGGIMDLWSKEARIFKYGSGTGTNFSSLRAEGEPLSGGGKSSGLMSWLRIGDRSAGAIKSGGTTRRAAKMVCLNLDHPDIEKFISWKMGEEYKVATMVAGSRAIRRAQKNLLAALKSHGTEVRENKALRKAMFRAQEEGVPPHWLKRTLDLAKQGVFEDIPPEFTTAWESPSYETVSGQNSNNSVRIPNSFFQKLDDKALWDLTARTSGKVHKSVAAEDLWGLLAHSAWSCADPGVQFDTTINEWHTCPEAGRIEASNPCSEYLFTNDSGCNLASINLVKFLQEDGSF